MKYKAPADTTSISLSTGTVQVVDGFVTVKSDLNTADLSGLSANGFTAHSEAAPAVATAPTGTVTTKSDPQVSTASTDAKA
jgi:hypothetical protein